MFENMAWDFDMKIKDNKIVWKIINLLGAFHLNVYLNCMKIIKKALMNCNQQFILVDLVVVVAADYW